MYEYLFHPTIYIYIYIYMYMCVRKINGKGNKSKHFFPEEVFDEISIWIHCLFFGLSTFPFIFHILLEFFKSTISPFL